MRRGLGSSRVVDWLVYVLTSYLAVLVVLWAFQSRLLYLPERSTPTSDELARNGLRWWPERPSAEGYRGLLASAEGTTARGTIVVFHGNAGAAIDRLRFLTPLKRAGFRVLLTEYPGYGWRGGAPSEEALVHDGIETLARLRDEFGDPVYVWGESLGAGVAAAVAGRAGQIAAGLVLLTPWEDLRSVARHHYWYLPAQWLVKDRYDSAANLARYAGPVALLVAERDTTIPPEHGRRLYEALLRHGVSTRLWSFPQAGHGDWPDGPDAPWWSEVIEFTATKQGISQSAGASAR